MHRLRNSILLLAAALLAFEGAVLPQTGPQLVTSEVRRVGERLACKCGACNNTVGNCPMLECHSASPARTKIAAMQKAGKSDDDIVASFVKETGLSALSEPPNRGFNRLGYLMPFIAILLGLGGIWYYMTRYAKKPAAAGVQPLDDEMLSRYRDRIDKDMAKLD